MGSLFAEYRDRHKINDISLVNESVVFFEKNGKPDTVCITSSHSKAHQICQDCNPDKSDMTIELFQFVRGALRCCSHYHAAPDENLLKNIDKSFHLANCKDDRDQERWLWEFFIQGSQIGNLPEFKRFVKTLPNGDPRNFISEMTYFATNMPNYFEVYFLHVYNLCLVNRTYITTSFKKSK